jgi:hypothetical protein
MCVPLPAETIEDLDRLGRRYLRTSRQQAAYLILEGLARERRRRATGLDAEVPEVRRDAR